MLRRDWFDFTAIAGRLLSWVGGEKDGGGEGRGEGKGERRKGAALSIWGLRCSSKYSTRPECLRKRVGWTFLL